MATPLLKSLVRLKPYMKRYRRRLILGIASFGVSRVFEASIPLLLALGIDRIEAGNTDLKFPVLGIFAAVALRYVTVTFARYSVRRSGFYISFDLRRALYDALQKQGSAFFNRYTIGDMMTRAVADIGLIQRLFSHGTVHLVIVVYATLVGFGFMLYLSPMLTLLMLPPLPCVFFYTRYSSRRMGLASVALQERLSDMGAHVQENLSGIRTIQAMVQEDNEIQRFGQTNQAYVDAFYTHAKINSLMSAWMPSLAAACSITILGYGGHLVLEGHLSVGELVAFFMYVNMVVQPFRMAGRFIELFQRAGVACRRLFDVLSLDPEIADTPTGGTPTQIHGRIELNTLSFRYPKANEAALNNIDLTIRQGESLAIMGRVGAGKSTLLKLIVRLLDTERGTVFIDGHDICDYPLAQLRSQVAMVPQDPFLFGESIRDNLTYDDPTRNLEDVWAAATSADLKTTIESFPNGLDTLVGERGVTLSGGQKQRATLARGLIRQAPVLILDDCFSSVDTETEEHILSELKRLRRGQTTILVSHRVSTARHTDRILVLEAGRIAELGTHRELIERGGLYAELERIQREGADDADYETRGAGV